MQRSRTVTLTLLRPQPATTTRGRLTRPGARSRRVVDHDGGTRHEAGSDRGRIELINGVRKQLTDINLERNSKSIDGTARAHDDAVAEGGSRRARSARGVYTATYGCIHDVAFKGLDNEQQVKFREALDKGPADPQGQNGIKIYEKKPYIHELKIYGAHGNARIYGKKIGTVLHFSKYQAHPH